MSKRYLFGLPVANFLLPLFMILSLQNLCAQEIPPRTDDHIFVDRIKTVQFFNLEDLFSKPLVELNAEEGTLFLGFDDLDGDIKDYVYTLTHCDADWKLSDLTELEYIDGFNGERIEDYENASYDIRTNFTHYYLYLPNEDIKWTKSGNYILTIYDDEGDEPVPVITRRLMVYENKFTISTQILRSRKVDHYQTHQKLDFNILHPGTKISDPQREVKVYIMQNNRWDNMLTGFLPIPIRKKENQLDYNLMEQVVFPALKDFRQLGLRSLEYRSAKIDVIEKYQDSYDVYLFPDEKRTYSPYVFDFDINGRFFIQNNDKLNLDYSAQPTTARIDTSFFQNSDTTSRNVFGRLNTVSVRTNKIPVNRQRLLDIHRESDYATVFFYLNSPTELYDAEIFLFGAFTDWKLQDQFKLRYNLKTRQYETNVFLKQGVYNYLYAVRHKDRPKIIDLTEIEGSSYETENEYTIFVYYRPFGARYDQLLGVKTFGTHD